jgi:hypothetical protein
VRHWGHGGPVCRIAPGSGAGPAGIERFDAELLRAGCDPAISATKADGVTALPGRGLLLRSIRVSLRSLHYRALPGRQPLRVLLRSVLRLLSQLGVEWV